MARKRRRWSVGAVIATLVGIAAVVFAVQGGEYGTSDLFYQRARRKRLVSQIDTLQREIDSLSRLKHAILTDPAVEERIAREEFGMVRGDKEILYRFAEPADSAKRAGR